MELEKKDEIIQNRMRILIVIGTRPEAIKMAPLIITMKQNYILIVKFAHVQHRQLLDQALNFLK